MGNFLKRFFRVRDEQKGAPIKVLDINGMRHLTSILDNKYVNKIDSPFTLVKITQAEYDRLSSKDNMTIYFIVG